MNKYFKKLDYKLINKEIVYKGKRITVEKLLYYNKRKKQNVYREHVKAGKATAIIPVTNNNKFIMLQEARTPIDEIILSFPAGMVENMETEEECAKRELEEETGYKAKYLKKLREVYTTVGYSDEKVTIFLAKDLVKTQTKFDDTEDIKVVEVDIKEAKEMLEKNEFKSSCETIGLLHYFLYEDNKY